MKTLFISLAVAMVFIILAFTQPSNSLRDLKKAYELEAKNSYQYKLFARKAHDDGYVDVANLFTAVSKSEEILMNNQLKLIQKLGSEPNRINYPVFEVATTKKNLKESIHTESKDEKYTYLQFALDALKEENEEAKETFIYSINAQQEHKNLFKQAGKNLDNYQNYDFYISNKTGETLAISKGLPEPQGQYEGEVYIRPTELP